MRWIFRSVGYGLELRVLHRGEHTWPKTCYVRRAIRGTLSGQAERFEPHVVVVREIASSMSAPPARDVQRDLHERVDVRFVFVTYTPSSSHHPDSRR
jgi:hypothetical protein